jgi:signal peptidase II
VSEVQDHSVIRLRQWLFLIGTALLIILLDRASKAYVVAHLGLHESWMPLDFIEPIFRFTRVHNTGAAFGIFPQGNAIFLTINLVVSLFIIYYYRHLPPGASLIRLALGLQLGGALGNAIDRIRTGYVVDFLHLEHWPVANIADISIVLGVVLLAFEIFREERRIAQQTQAAESAQKHEHQSDSSEEEALYG